MRKLKVLKKIKNSNFKIFTEKPKELSNKHLSDILAFLPKSKKRSKRLKINQTSNIRKCATFIYMIL